MDLSPYCEVSTKHKCLQILRYPNQHALGLVLQERGEQTVSLEFTKPSFRCQTVEKFLRFFLVSARLLDKKEILHFSQAQLVPQAPKGRESLFYPRVPRRW